jgi:D-alanine-D-alanine ligase-like ATP-grasp enzyme
MSSFIADREEKNIERKKAGPSSARRILAVAPQPKGDASGDASREEPRARCALFREALTRVDFEVAYREIGAPADLREAIRDFHPDLLFSLFTKSDFSEGKGVFSEILQRKESLFIGDPRASLEFASSKSRLKRALKDGGIETPNFFSVYRTKSGSVVGRKELGRARDFPYIIKPDREDESRRARARSVAFNAAALAASVESALEEYGYLLVEHFAGGASSREYAVALIGNGERALGLPAEMTLEGARPIRAITSEDRERGLVLVRPLVAGLESERIRALAKRASVAAGLRDYGRCDIIDEGGRLLVLDVDALPGLPVPWFEACASGAGLGASQYIIAIVLAAIARIWGPGAGIDGALAKFQAALPLSIFESLVLS